MVASCTVTTQPIEARHHGVQLSSLQHDDALRSRQGSPMGCLSGSTPESLSSVSNPRSSSALSSARATASASCTVSARSWLTSASNSAMRDGGAAAGADETLVEAEAGGRVLIDLFLSRFVLRAPFCSSCGRSMGALGALGETLAKCWRDAGEVLAKNTKTKAPPPGSHPRKVKKSIVPNFLRLLHLGLWDDA